METTGWSDSIGRKVVAVHFLDPLLILGSEIWYPEHFQSPEHHGMWPKSPSLRRGTIDLSTMSTARGTSCLQMGWALHYQLFEIWYDTLYFLSIECTLVRNLRTRSRHIHTKESLVKNVWFLIYLTCKHVTSSTLRSQGKIYPPCLPKSPA